MGIGLCIPSIYKKATSASCSKHPLYDGACGVLWALDYLEAVEAAALSRSHAVDLDELLARNRALLEAATEPNRASFLLGDTPIRMLSFGAAPTDDVAQALDALIAGNTGHPARELMLGSPGTLLAALSLYERTGNKRWSDLFRLTAGRLWSQLEWSPERDVFLLDAAVVRPALHLSWCRARFRGYRLAIGPGAQPAGRRRMGRPGGLHRQYGAARGRSTRCARQLVAGARRRERCSKEAASVLPWSAGLRHLSRKPAEHGARRLAARRGGDHLGGGTAHQGFQPVSWHRRQWIRLCGLYQRTHDSMWLQRARSFAMHGIAQTEDGAHTHGQFRYSLWTGDLGFAIYLWDCLRAQAQFPTLDVFYQLKRHRSGP